MRYGSHKVTQEGIYALVVGTIEGAEGRENVGIGKFFKQTHTKQQIIKQNQPIF
jgi:hypothetical protein